MPGGSDPTSSTQAATPRLVRRLRQLRGWEAVNVLLMPALFAWIWRERGVPVSWWLRGPPLALVSVVLAQGAWYWHLKLRSVRQGRPLPAWFCRTFEALRAGAALGWVAVLVLVVAGWRRGWGGGADLGWAVALLLFAALELVNYYHRQLMHDSAADWVYLRRHRRLRRSPLATDLARCGGGERRA